VDSDVGEMPFHMLTLCLSCPPLLYFYGSLTVDAGCAAERGGHITTNFALNIPPLPGLLPQQKSWCAGQEHAEQAAQETRLAQSLGILVHLAARAAVAEAAHAAVAKAAKEILFPFGHFVFLRSKGYVISWSS